MDKQAFRYMLRYTMEPGHCEAERRQNLLDFCQQAQVSDVMFFFNCEELNRGHFTADELKEWLELIAGMKPILAERGITTSINPWTTFLHTDRGRQLRPGQNFTRMVDPCGREAAAVACPLDETFLDYLAWQYRTCAEVVRPEVLWLEDDFRLHNHHPLEWGGCFCSRHLELFSRLAGRPLIREEFISGLLAPGPVHPYRKIWLDTARDALIRAAEKVRDAVMDAAPDTRLALMTSDPVAHAAEGRDWPALFQALKTRRDPYIRIHLPSYQETAAQQYGSAFQAVSRQVRHLTPDWVENYSELENFTFTRYSSSLSFTQMQLETSILLDSKGITLNIFDMLGNGALLGERYQEVMAASKPFLDSLAGLGFQHQKQAGVHVMIDPRCVYHLTTSQGRSMYELNNRERGLMQLIAPFGIASCYDSSHQPRGQVTAVSGQYLRNLEQSEIEALFRHNFVLLDGEAIMTLQDLGLGRLAGIEQAQIITEGDGQNACEEVVDGRVYQGISRARMTMQAGAGDFIRITYHPDARRHDYTCAFSPFGEDNGPAMVRINDQVFILPYMNYSTALLNPFRKQILLDAIGCWQLEKPVYTNEPHTAVFHYRLAGRTLLALANFSGDTWDTVSLTYPDGVPAWEKAMLYSRSHPQGQEIEPVCDTRTLQIAQNLPRLGLLVLELLHGL